MHCECDDARMEQFVSDEAHWAWHTFDDGWNAALAQRAELICGYVCDAYPVCEHKYPRALAKQTQPLTDEEAKITLRRALLVPVSAYRSSADPQDYDAIVAAAFAWARDRMPQQAQPDCRGVEHDPDKKCIKCAQPEMPTREQVIALPVRGKSINGDEYVSRSAVLALFAPKARTICKCKAATHQFSYVPGTHHDFECPLYQYEASEDNA